MIYLKRNGKRVAKRMSTGVTWRAALEMAFCQALPNAPVEVWEQRMGRHLHLATVSEGSFYS